jgi:ribosomal protein S18 acetylase RimI-like enzyme
MRIRPYTGSDWEAVREIYDLSKPDEMRGAIDLDTILPLNQDPAMLALFHDSIILVAHEAEQIVGFGGHKGNYISWLFVHPAHRRQGVARALLKEIIERLNGLITLNVAAENLAARQLYSGLGFTVARDFAGQFNGQGLRVLTLSYERAG